MTRKAAVTTEWAARCRSLLPVAFELERWTSAMPAFDLDSDESWQTFQERQRRFEEDLAERLIRLPGCRVELSPRGTQTHLSLAGVDAYSHVGLVTACREWIAKVRLGAWEEGDSGE